MGGSKRVLTDLALKDISVDPSSYVDPQGFVFHHDGKLYRAIRGEHEAFYRELFTKGTIDRLTRDQGLVESSLTDLSITEKNCSMVVAHKKISPLNYCVEWCPAMLREAALATLRLNLKLLEKNRMLQDAYPWNIVFSGTSPIFVDLTSIVPASHPLVWPAYQQFLNFFLYPLILSSEGKGKEIRRLLFDYVEGISHEDFLRGLPAGYKWRHPLRWIGDVALGKADAALQRYAPLKAALSRASESSKEKPTLALRKRFTERLIKTVEAIPAPSPSGGWTSYGEEEHAPGQRKREIIDELLKAARPKTVLDLGCNTGEFSMAAARLGSSVRAVDSDEGCIDALYHNSRRKGFDILPLVSDALNPTPAFGFMAKQFPPLTDRLRSEFVLCLGLMHHLHIKGRQSFDGITAMLDGLCTRGVLFEFVDQKDSNCDLLHHGRPFEYSEEDVMRALKSRFNLTVKDSDRPSRKIVLCEKRD